jgi:RNA polymerase sigma-70 factor (ECF subfamily)
MTIMIIKEVDFDEIYLLYYPRLLLCAIKLTGNKEESEEIIQDVFIRFWLKQDYLNIKFSIKAYLFRCVHNACLDYLKKEQLLLVVLPWEVSYK